MTVIDFAKYASKDTISVLEGLLAMAYAEGGSLVVVHRSPAGNERTAVTGAYARDSELALKAIMKVSVHLTTEEEQVRGKP